MATRRFKAQETTTYRDLQATMRKLGATSLRVPRDLLDSKSTQAEIVFDLKGIRYVVRCGKWSLWLDNFRAAERCIFYLYRAIDEYGVTTNEQRFADTVRQFFAGFEALPNDEVLLLGSGQWWDVLGIDQHASKADIINAYRALAHQHHPDHGGDRDTYQRVRAAYEEGLKARAAA